ncbi:hypothetical protein E2320_009908, partial [Naja naja]
MITGFSKSPGQKGPQPESYEEKYERRCKKHESLLRRNNRTTCRLIGKEAKGPAQSPRQKEFFRRRNLTTEELGRTKMMLPPGKKKTLFPVNCSDNLGEIPPQTYLNYLSNIQPHTKSIQHNFSNIFPLSKSSQAMPVMNVPKNCKGTQTTKEQSSEKKNSCQQTDCGTAVLDKEIIQLSNYLNEALHRELVLKQKMVILQELLAMLLEAAEKSWKATNVELATGRKRLAFTADIQSLKRQEKMRKRRARPAIKGCPLKCTKLGREGRREERISSPTKANVCIARD